MKKSDFNTAIRGESKEQLQARLLELRQSHMRFRFNRVIDSVENTAEFKKIRRNIARVQTQLSVLESQPVAGADANDQTDKG